MSILVDYSTVQAFMSCTWCALTVNIYIYIYITLYTYVYVYIFTVNADHVLVMKAGTVALLNVHVKTIALGPTRSLYNKAGCV